MHLIMLIIAIVCLAKSMLRRRDEKYVDKNWNSCTGKIVKIDVEPYDSDSQLAISTIRYELKNRVFEFREIGSVNGKIGESVELLYSPMDIRKVTVKKNWFSKSSKWYMLLSVFYFCFLYLRWQPITLIDLIIFFVFLGVILLFSIFIGDFLFIQSLIHLLQHTIERQRENAKDITEP